MDGFTALRCTQCGGKVEITNDVFEESFKDIGGGEVIFRSTERVIKCESCGTQFVPNTITTTIDGNATVVVNTGGGAYVNGKVEVRDGDFVGRDKVVIRYR